MKNMAAGNPFADPMQKPMKSYGCMSIAGKSAELGQLHRAMVNFYNDVDVFSIPDDHAEFPDTRGYTSENFADLESTVEDPALYAVMQKCIDAVLDRTNKKYERFCEQYPGKVEKFIHWPKFGGSVFAVVGMVKVYPHAITLVH